VGGVVYGLATWTILRHRRRPDTDELPEQRHGSLRLEIAWTAIPILIVVGLFIATLPVLTRVEALTSNPAVQVRVEAFRWGWRAQYADAGVEVSGLLEPGPEIVVPVGEPLRVTLSSVDVVHAFYVPVFLFKRDAIPGRETHFELTIDEPGDYGGQCAEFCGISHYRMPFTVRAVARAEYDAWLAAQPRPTPARSLAPSPSPAPTSSP
jgi:cytochrome c oxidase subunit 2